MIDFIPGFHSSSVRIWFGLSAGPPRAEVEEFLELLLTTFGGLGVQFRVFRPMRGALRRNACCPPMHRRNPSNARNQIENYSSMYLIMVSYGST